MKLTTLHEDVDKFALLQKLIKELSYLLSFNMAHLDGYATTPDGQRKVAKMVQNLLPQGKELLSKLDTTNRGQVSRNAQNIINFTYQLIRYMKPLMKHLPVENVPKTLGNAERIYRQLV